MFLRRRKLLWSLLKMLLSARRTQLPVDCLWSLVPSFPGVSVNSDNLPFSYVILLMYSLICHYMHEIWSWHAYRFALGFLWKNRCDTFTVKAWILTIQASLFSGWVPEDLHVDASVLVSFGVMFIACLDYCQASWSSSKVLGELIPKVSSLA
jgi:hypothetical protein